MYLGTKGTLIMLREREALLFEEAGGGRQTGIEVTPAGNGAAAQSSETMAAHTTQGAARAPTPVDGGRRRVGALRDAAADAAVLLGDSRRHAAGLRSRQGHRLRTRLHRRERGHQDQGACEPAYDLGRTYAQRMLGIPGSTAPAAPASRPGAILGLLLLTVFVPWIGSLAVRRMQISYGTET